MQRGVYVHITKQQMVLDGLLSSQMTATVLGLTAEIERELIALRTREALAKRRVEGKPLGRPKGQPATRLKLDAQEAVLRGLPGQGYQQAGDHDTARGCAVNALCVVGPAEPLALAQRETRPRPFSTALRRLVSSGKEQGG